MHRREREGSWPQRRRTPSFSSTLLDSIYRSIDESKTHLDDEDHQLALYNENTHSFNKNLNYFSYNNNHGVTHSDKGGKERMDLRRAVMLEDWMEKQSCHTSHLLNSSSSSSECSSGGMFSFSSSETDSSHNKKQISVPKSDKHQKQKQQPQQQPQQQQQQKPRGEGGFAKTKLRAMKMYGELNQKVKQPISPGSRIASFLSSIFNSENVKKAKMCYVGAVQDVNFEHKSKSPCFSSTPSSIISRRSCMTKTPSSAKGNKSNNNGIKRSVRFYPVSMILGEDSDQPIGHKYVYENDPSLLPHSTVRKVTRNSSTKDQVKNNVMAKGYESSTKGKFDIRGFYDNGEEEDEDEDEDALSYSSSDLFELDHLIGGGRYQEELPVYETTNLEKNKAIAIGLRL